MRVSSVFCDPYKELIESHNLQQLRLGDVLVDEVRREGEALDILPHPALLLREENHLLSPAADRQGTGVRAEKTRLFQTTVTLQLTTVTLHTLQLTPVT